MLDSTLKSFCCLNNHLHNFQQINDLIKTKIQFPPLPSLIRDTSAYQIILQLVRIKRGYFTLNIVESIKINCLFYIYVLTQPKNPVYILQCQTSKLLNIGFTKFHLKKSILPVYFFRFMLNDIQLIFYQKLFFKFLLITNCRGDEENVCSLQDNQNNNEC